MMTSEKYDYLFLFLLKYYKIKIKSAKVYIKFCLLLVISILTINLIYNTI